MQAWRAGVPPSIFLCSAAGHCTKRSTIKCNKVLLRVGWSGSQVLLRVCLSGGVYDRPVKPRYLRSEHLSPGNTEAHPRGTAGALRSRSVRRASSAPSCLRPVPQPRHRAPPRHRQSDRHQSDRHQSPNLPVRPALACTPSSLRQSYVRTYVREGFALTWELPLTFTAQCSSCFCNNCNNLGITFHA